MTQHWFIEPQRRGSKLVFFASALAFIVILLGAYTRLTDAGLSCPDWPHCFGYLTAPHTDTQLQQAALNFPTTQIDVKKAWTEMAHRYVAGSEGIFILLISIIILANQRNRSGKNVFISFFLLGLLCVQVMLGMFTVTAKLKPAIVTAHLMTGLSLLCVLWWVYLESKYQSIPVRRNSVNLVPWLALGFLIAFGQIFLGGWVSSHYAGLACIDLPYCNGKLLPTLQWGAFNTDLITIHMVHRLGALITGIYFLLLAINLIRTTSYRTFGLCFLFIILMQLTLGVLNVMWLRPVYIALMHQGVAIFLLLTALTALVKTHFESQEHRYVAWPT